MKLSIQALSIVLCLSFTFDIAWITGAIGDTEGQPFHPDNPTGPVSFVGEKISLTITPKRVSVTGRYFMHSNQPGKHTIPLAYPFPLGAASDYPDTIRVYREENGIPVIFEENRKQGDIFFSIEAEGDFEFTAYYSQKLRKHEATYILTTTKEWGAPLKSADFYITMPNSMIPIFWSFTPDSKKRSKGFTTYSIHRTDFLPLRDLTVRWKIQKAK
ncbi:MAG: DUF4424 family protein [Candidatus Latescibacterota bacterium]